MSLWLLVIALFLIAFRNREDFTDPDSPVTRPAKNAVWLSKIDAEAPIGGNDDDYIAVLQAFYDKVYVPSAVRPKDTDVEAFLRSADGQKPGVDPNSLRKIIAAAFRIERTLPASAREEAQVKFQPTAALQPQMGVDQVYNRTEDIYQPADSRRGDLPEGLYAPTEQQEEPRRPGTWDDKSTSWSRASFFSTCECAKNVL